MKDFKFKFITVLLLVSMFVFHSSFYAYYFPLKITKKTNSGAQDSSVEQNPDYQEVESDGSVESYASAESNPSVVYDSSLESDESLGEDDGDKSSELDSHDEEDFIRKKESLSSGKKDGSTEKSELLNSLKNSEKDNKKYVVGSDGKVYKHQRDDSNGNPLFMPIEDEDTGLIEN